MPTYLTNEAAASAAAAAGEDFEPTFCFRHERWLPCCECGEEPITRPAQHGQELETAPSQEGHAAGAARDTGDEEWDELIGARYDAFTEAAQICQAYREQLSKLGLPHEDSALGCIQLIEKARDGK